MFNLNEFTATTNILRQLGSDYQQRWGQHHVNARPHDLLRWMELCRDDLGYLTLIDIVGIDHGSEQPERNYRLEMVYHLMSMGQHQRLNIHLHFNPAEIIPRIVDFYPNADWLEREQAEMLQITFNQPLAALLLPAGQKVYPLKKVIDGEVSWPNEPERKAPVLRFNPNKSEAPYPEEKFVWEQRDIFSLETMGNFEWQICFDPSKLVDSRVHIGFHHQGFEKLLEKHNWLHIMQLIDKLHLGAAPTYSIAWAKILEEMLEITLTERAQAIRVVLLELARIVEHLTVFAEMTIALKREESKLFINAREKLYELFEKYCGHRQGIGVIRLGGLREDLPYGWIVEYQRSAEIIKKALHVVHNSLLSQATFRENLSTGSIHPQTILQWGVSGPTMRAAGLNFDLRKSQPFYFYQDIDFDIPVGIHGSSYDRYLIRYEEIFQSFRIITQVLDNLPLGNVIDEEYQQDYFALDERLKRNIPRFWHYAGLESPNGEAGIFLLLASDFKPDRIKIKTPSFNLAQALPYFIKGITREQLQANLASFGLRRFEMDR